MVCFHFRFQGGRERDSDGNLEYGLELDILVEDLSDGGSISKQSPST